MDSKPGRTVWRWVFVAAFAMAVGVSAVGQPKAPDVDPETFRQATERLKARAATQPDEATRLRAENAELKKRVDELEARVLELLAEIKKHLAAETPETKAVRQGMIKVGMTLAQIRTATNQDGKTDAESAREKTMRFVDYKKEGNVISAREVTVFFRDDKATDLTYSGWVAAGVEVPDDPAKNKPRPPRRP